MWAATSSKYYSLFPTKEKLVRAGRRARRRNRTSVFRARVRWIGIKPKAKYFEVSQYGKAGDHQRIRNRARREDQARQGQWQTNEVLAVPEMKCNPTRDPPKSGCVTLLCRMPHEGDMSQLRGLRCIPFSNSKSQREGCCAS
jgi:hypothetical protein